MIELTGLPAWVQHNSDSQDFTIPYNDDLSLENVYFIEIKSTVFYPTSASDPTLSSVSLTTTLEIRLIEPCRLTQLLDWEIDPIVVTLGSPPEDFVLPAAQD